MSSLIEFFVAIFAAISICAGMFVILYFIIASEKNEYSTMKVNIELSDELQERVTANNYYNSNSILSPLNEWRKKNGVL